MNELENLFWNPTLNNGKGGINSFGTFALIVLGISLPYKLVKLVLAKRKICRDTKEKKIKWKKIKN